MTAKSADEILAEKKHLKAKEAKLRAKLLKIQSEQQELSDKGQLKKYRNQILISCGLAFFEQVSRDAEETRNEYLSLMKKKQEVMLRTGLPKNQAEDIEEVRVLAKQVSDKKDSLEKGGKKYCETVTELYFRPAIEKAKLINDEKKRSKRIEQLESLLSVTEKALIAVAHGTFK